MQENVDPSKIKDKNHANRLFNLYWEAPSDPTIYRRKLLNVQKTREKLQAARRGYIRGHGHSRSRSVSPSSQDGLPNIRNAFSNTNNQGDDTVPVTSNLDEPTNQAASRLVRQGSYQGSFNVSPSMTQFGSNQGIRLSNNSGAQLGFSGPQSLSVSVNSVGLPGSFNEVDFALALHRPGVVPMGDSVTTATTSTTSMSSGNQSNNQTSQVGSYGTHQVLQYTNQQRSFAVGSVPRTSRSFNEGDSAPAYSATIPTVIDSGHQPLLFSSSHEIGMEIGPPIELKSQVEISVDPPIELEGENIQKRPASTTSVKTDEVIPPTTEGASSPAPNADIPMNQVPPNENLGAFDAPLYQQQLAAMQQQFQQQQLLLQQQQAALALQQEQFRAQLQAYYSNTSATINSQQYGIPGAPAAPAANTANTGGLNTQQFGLPGAPATPATSINTQQFGIPSAQATASTPLNAQQFNLTGASAAAMHAQQFGLSSTTQGTVQAAGLNAQQFGLAGTATPIQGGGYYMVTAADGTQMIVTNPGVAIPISGQLQGIAPMPGMLSGLPAGPTQIQGINPLGLPPVGVAQGTVIGGIPGIQGIHAGSLIPPPGGMPYVGPAGMATLPTLNNNSSPAPTGLYPNTNQQQQHHRQP